MKFLLVLLVLLLLTSSVFAVSFSVMRGNRSYTSETRKLNQFNGIDFSGIGNFTIKKGNDYSIKITTDSNLIERFETNVSMGILGIRWMGPAMPTKVEAEIIIPEIKSITSSGTCNVILLDSWAGEEFEYNGSGTSIFTGELDYTSAKITCSGTVKNNLSGRIENLKIIVSGAVKINAEDLETEVVSIQASGACDLTLNVQEELKARASGAVKIYYVGNPALSLETSGAATIQNIND